MESRISDSIHEWPRHRCSSSDAYHPKERLNCMNDTSTFDNLSLKMKILIFEDNRRIRESLEQLLGGAPGFEVTGVFENATDAGNIASVYLPDVVLMDIDMPGTNGIEGVKLIKESNPQTNIIMFTVFEDANKLFDCL